MEAPGAASAKAVWKTLFDALPPRGVISRVANLVSAELPPESQYLNYHSKKGFLRELGRLERWYK